MANRSISEIIANPLNTVSYVRPKPLPVTSYAVHGRNASISDDDIKAAAPVIYGEVSNRPTDKQDLEARVILNTAINRMHQYAQAGKPRTLSEVLAMPNQYQAYGGKQYHAYSAPPDQLAMQKKQQIDAIMSGLMGEIKSRSFKDNTQGAFYYKHNPDGTITYDDTRPLTAGQPSPAQLRTSRGFSTLNQP